MLISRRHRAISLTHSSLSTTADVYAHLTRDMRRAADRMDAILGAPQRASTS